MAKRRNANCRNCGKHRDKVGRMSKRGLCARCSETLLESNVRSMATKRGENYSRYVDGMRKAADLL